MKKKLTYEEYMEKRSDLYKQWYEDSEHLLDKITERKKLLNKELQELFDKQYPKDLSVGD